MDLLTLDDNADWGLGEPQGDGNITNGTPHYDFIARGFGGHNLDAPALFTISYPNGRQVEWGQYQSFDLTAEVTANAGIAAHGDDELTLHYRLLDYNNPDYESAFQTAAFTRVGGSPPQWSDEWEVSLAEPQTCPAILEYYVTFKRHDGEYLTPDPAEAPEDAVFVAYYSVLIARHFEDDFEVDRQWEVSGSPAPTTGAWERVVPAAWGNLNEILAPASDFDGSGRCYLTQNNTGVDRPVAGGTTILSSPSVVIDQEEALVHFSLWFSNGYTNWMQDWANGDVLTVQIRDGSIVDPEVGWIALDGSENDVDVSIGPFEIASVPLADGSTGGWYQRYFKVDRNIFLLGIPQLIQVRFITSGPAADSQVEAALDDFRVFLLCCPPGCPGGGVLGPLNP